MLRLFSILIAIFFWSLSAIFLLIIAPVIWVAILTRTLAAFAIMMLLHAIASKKLRASARALEYSIVWYSLFLLRLYRALQSSLRLGGVRDESNYEEYLQEDIVLGKGLWRDILASLTWLAKNLLPAMLVLLPIYFGFRTLGIDLIANVSDGIALMELALWIGSWFIMGLVGILFIPLVRNFVVFPFVAIILLVWCVVGLIFWFPRIINTFAIYTAAVIRSSIRGDIDDKLAKILENGLLYYERGFRIIWSVLSNKKVVSKLRGKKGFAHDFQIIWQPLKRRLISLLYYPAVGLILYFFDLWPLAKDAG